jgi:U3 small nucleolar RNA-associated protein 4
MGEEQNTDEVEDVEEEDSDSDDSDNEETESKPLMGQFWTRVTAGGFIPKLPSPAVVLSFRPHAASGREIEDRLLVVTASSQVFEFDVLKGTLSAWSRNNPTETFPEEFRNVRDQVMGCLWDMSQSRERLWLYGNKWVFMFDLSRDFPRNEEMKQTRKRKHSGLDDLRRNTTGAGSKIAEGELETGMSRKFQKISHEEEGAQQSQDVVLSGRRKADAAADADAADDDAMDMVLDRGVAASKQGTSTDVTVTGTEGKKQAPHWWCTYKYRPIMGIVCVGGGVAGSDKPLEVALVERPEWELDLPPRYYGDQEWEKAGL